VTSTSETIETQLCTIDGLSIRYAESGGGLRGSHALLLNPWPESLFAYTPMWSRLAEQAHLVAIDLPGFGHSERRAELLSPQAMADFVIRVADEFGLDSPHLIGPDVGTAASLFAAAKHPGRLRSLVVGAGASAVPLQVAGALKDIIEAPDLETFRAADPREIVAGGLRLLERYELPDDIREDYLSAYEGDRLVESMNYVRNYPTDLPVLNQLLPQIETPVQIISGARDAFVPQSNSEFLHERLPKSKLDVLDAGHYPWEDAADEYAALVTAWWQGGYANVGPS
jgi:pimeloyl-ACP methyl ester carboxylesterase